MQAYAAVVEVESPKDAVAAASEEEDEEEGKPQNFLERMSRRDKREVRRGILQGGEPSPRPKTCPPASISRGKKKEPAAPAGPNQIEELSCSKDMKDFMRAEYDREKEIYKDVPEIQIANSIIHGFRTHQANSGMPMDVSSLKSKDASTKRRTSGRKKQLSSVEIGSGQESDEDEISIQEFDEAEFQPLAEGSFSLSPSPRQLRSRRNLLVRFTTDDETIPITNGPGQVLQRYTLGNEDLEGGEEKKAASKTGRKSKKKSPRREKRPVVEVDPRKTPAKRRKRDESLSSPVVASSGSKAVTTSQGDAKTKKTVTINSQPEFFSSSEPADEFCPEEEGVVVPLKSILKKFPLPEEVAPPTPSSQGSVTEEDGKLSQPASQERPRPVKVNLLDKFNEVSPVSDENFANLLRDMEKIHNSPNISLEEEDGTREEKKFLEDLVTAKSCGSCGGGGGEGGSGELSQCGRCKTVAYCDERCQKTDWPKHKLVCADLAKLRGKEDDGKSRKQEKKDLIQSVLLLGASNTEPKTNSVKTPSPCPSTPETSPTLAQSIRTQSIKRSHRKRHLPVLGRRATPHHSDETKDKVHDVQVFGIPRKIDFAAVAINDEVVEEVEFLKFCSSSLEMSADGSSPPTDQGEEEKPDPPSSFEILDDAGPQKEVSWLPPLH